MDLSKLPVEGGVRLRGEQVTRLETFVDAAFAFAMTLLVVSFDAMPESFSELYDALRRLPAFLAGDDEGVTAEATDDEAHLVAAE